MGRNDTTKNRIRSLRPDVYQAFDSTGGGYHWHGANFNLSVTVPKGREYKWTQVIADSPNEVYNLKTLPDTLVDGDRNPNADLMHPPFYFDSLETLAHLQAPYIDFNDNPRSYQPGKRWYAQTTLVSFDPASHRARWEASFEWGYKVIEPRSYGVKYPFKRVYHVWPQTQHILDSLSQP